LNPQSSQMLEKSWFALDFKKTRTKKKAPG